MSRVERAPSNYYSRGNLNNNADKFNYKLGKNHKVGKDEIHKNIKTQQFHTRQVALAILSDQQERCERVKSRLEKKLKQKEVDIEVQS